MPGSPPSAPRSSASNGLMAQATNIDDLITLESAISSARASFESLEAQQRYLADQVSMSTISLYLRSDAGGAEDGAGRLLSVSRPAGTPSWPFWADCSWCSECCSRG